MFNKAPSLFQLNQDFIYLFILKRESLKLMTENNTVL